MPQSHRIDPIGIIDRYYTEGQLRDILLTHSMMVRDKALECISRCGLEVDQDFVAEAAMLHDIGIIRCNAPDICCHGSLPYICHGIEGAKMLRDLDLPRHARVCERHTGAGLTVEDIQDQHLPLPLRDMTPQSIEEKLICYADKFYSKSGDLTRPKPIDKVIASMARHGEDSLARFLSLHVIFG